MSKEMAADGAEQSAPLRMLPPSRTWGASLFTVRIYEAVAESGAVGLTVKEIHAQLRQIPGFIADTKRWAQGKKVLDSQRREDIEYIALERIRQQVRNLVTDGVLKNRTYPPAPGRYIAGNPPRGYRRKWVLNDQRPIGYYPINPGETKAASQRQIQIAQWIERAKKELSRPKSRRYRELVEQILPLVEN